MRRDLLLLLVFAIGVLGSVLAYVAYASYVTFDTRIIDVEFKAVEPGHIGFNLNTSTLAFGMIPQGGTGERKTTLSSPVRVRVRFVYSENLQDILLATPARLVLEPDVAQNVTFSLTLPKDYPLGNYTGTLAIRYERLLPWQQS